SVHFAAGLAICEAAGCVVTDLRGRPWREGAAGLIAAADAETHTRLLALVRKSGGYTLPGGRQLSVEEADDLRVHRLVQGVAIEAVGIPRRLAGDQLQQCREAGDE